MSQPINYATILGQSDTIDAALQTVQIESSKHGKQLSAEDALVALASGILDKQASLQVDTKTLHNLIALDRRLVAESPTIAEKLYKLCITKLMPNAESVNAINRAAEKFDIVSKFGLGQVFDIINVSVGKSIEKERYAAKQALALEYFEVLLNLDDQSTVTTDSQNRMNLALRMASFEDIDHAKLIKNLKKLTPSKESFFQLKTLMSHESDKVVKNTFRCIESFPEEDFNESIFLELNESLNKVHESATFSDIVDVFTQLPEKHPIGQNIEQINAAFRKIPQPTMKQHTLMAFRSLNEDERTADNLTRLTKIFTSIKNDDLRMMLPHKFTTESLVDAEFIFSQIKDPADQEAVIKAFSRYPSPDIFRWISQLGTTFDSSRIKNFCQALTFLPEKNPNKEVILCLAVLFLHSKDHSALLQDLKTHPNEIARRYHQFLTMFDRDSSLPQTRRTKIYNAIRSFRTDEQAKMLLDIQMYLSHFSEDKKDDALDSLLQESNLFKFLEDKTH